MVIEDRNPVSICGVGIIIDKEMKGNMVGEK